MPKTNDTYDIHVPCVIRYAEEGERPGSDQAAWEQLFDAVN